MPKRAGADSKSQQSDAVALLRLRYVGLTS
jgi:hypothetical protein